jgi:hypothetical protein
MSDNAVSTSDHTVRTSLQGWYRRDRPSILAAAWFWLFFVLLAAVTLLTGWASLPVTLGLQSILSLGAGALAAWLLQREGRLSPRYSHSGALAGLYLTAITAAAIIGLAVLIGIGSLGATLPLMLPYFLSLPVQAINTSLFGAVGAYITQFFIARKRTNNSE